MAEQNQPLSVRIDPIKYLSRLPEFNGDYRELQNFTNLVDRVHPILAAYDEPSQLLFSDLIKARLTGRAREIIEINCQAQSWADIRTILNNNFGDRCSLEELFDKLKSTNFTSNSVEFYNEIKQRLRNLNNKTILTIGPGPAANECARNNRRTALNVFKEKIPEPMRTILTCRNPETLEGAMEILFQAGYAYSSPSGGISSAYGKPPNKSRQYHSSTQISSHNRQTQRQTNNNGPNFSHNRQGRTDQINYNQHNGQYLPQRSNNQNNFNQHNRQHLPQSNYNQHNRQYLPQRNNNQNNYNQHDGRGNWNPFRRQDRTNSQWDNRLPTPEPMDINKFETPTNHNQNIHKNENFRSSASGNYHI